MKVVGVGSVGLDALAALFDGGRRRRPAVPPGQGGPGVGPRALPPAEPATPTTASGSSPGSGLQATSDIFLGWTTGELGRHVYVRQLQDQKAGAVIEAMTAGRPRGHGASCAPGRSPAATRDPASPRRSRRTSGRTRRSSMRSGDSRRHTPTRPSATSRRSRPRPRRAGSRPSRGLRSAVRAVRRPGPPARLRSRHGCWQREEMTMTDDTSATAGDARTARAGAGASWRASHSSSPACRSCSRPSRSGRTRSRSTRTGSPRSSTHGHRRARGDRPAEPSGSARRSSTRSMSRRGSRTACPDIAKSLAAPLTIRSRKPSTAGSRPRWPTRGSRRR